MQVSLTWLQACQYTGNIMMLNKQPHRKITHFNSLSNITLPYNIIMSKLTLYYNSIMSKFLSLLPLTIYHLSKSQFTITEHSLQLYSPIYRLPHRRLLRLPF